MNYLAHALLSFGHEDILVGNIIADFTPIKDISFLSQNIQKGIELHKSIDSFTDKHHLTTLTTSKLFVRHGKYAPVLTDIIYDLFLIKYWAIFSNKDLSAFVFESHTILESKLISLSEIPKTRLKNMLQYNFLSAYFTEEGFKKSMLFMDKRTTFPSKFIEVAEDINEHRREMENEFLSFFPELLTHTKSKFDQLFAYPSK